MYRNLARFIKGSLILSSELVQTRRDLSRTQLAEKRRRQGKARKNTPLQSGGTLNVDLARNMIVQREEEELAKARRIIEAAEKKQHLRHKIWRYEAAKKATAWRIDGRLPPYELYESGRSVRCVKR